MALNFISGLNKRILPTPKSRNICEPVPTVKYAPDPSVLNCLGAAVSKKASILPCTFLSSASPSSTNTPWPSFAIRSKQESIVHLGWDGTAPTKSRNTSAWCTRTMVDACGVISPMVSATCVPP